MKKNDIRIDGLERAKRLIAALADDETPEGLRAEMVEWFRSPVGWEEKGAALDYYMHRTLSPALVPVSKPKRSLRRRIYLRAASVAAAVLVVLGITFGLLNNHRAAVDGGAAQIALVVVETVEGAQKSVTLPDGTKVWLNSGSKLSYPERFAGDERRVRLEGEAYYEVRHDETKPFFVQTDKLEVKVLGTKFDVSAVGAETSVVLDEGAVEVNVENKRAMLKPGQQLTYNHNTGEVAMKRVTNSRDWRSDYVFAEMKTVPEIVGMIGEYYDTNIIISDSAAFDNDLYSIGFNRHETTESVLAILSSIVSTGFTFERRDDDTIIIKNR